MRVNLKPNYFLKLYGVFII